MFYERILKALCLLLPVLSLITAQDEEAVWELGSHRADSNQAELKLWLTISAEQHFLEVSWKNAPAQKDDHIMLTTKQPERFEKVKPAVGTPLSGFGNKEGRGFVPVDGYTTTQSPIKTLIMHQSFDQEGSGEDEQTSSPIALRKRQDYWISNGGDNHIVAAIQPDAKSQWFTTGVPFDYALSRNVTVQTKCYGYWASYINAAGGILATTCLRAYPLWMNEMRSYIGGLRFRDLLLVGTHNSGSYRSKFLPFERESIVTKYALCQDDEIRGQLMHGARYLDLRVGFYRQKSDMFYINHGFAIQQPLQEVLNQLKDFVMETNEIVIVGFKEFPVGKSGYV